MDTAEAVLCRCGHDRESHQHYRPGSDCALCECQRWSPPTWLSRLLGRLGRLRAAVRFRVSRW